MNMSTNSIKEVLNFKDGVEVAQGSLQIMKWTMTINKTD